jgi:multiple sugar transport system substrate-binding protein
LERFRARKVIIPECQKALGIKLTIEMINGNDIQARTTSAIQSGTGPDVICVLNNWAQLYPESVVDVSEVAEEIAKAQDGFYEESRVVANDGEKWIAVPWCVLGAQLAYRNSGSKKSATPPENFPRTGRNTVRPAKSSNP